MARKKKPRLSKAERLQRERQAEEAAILEQVRQDQERERVAGTFEGIEGLDYSGLWHGREFAFILKDRLSAGFKSAIAGERETFLERLSPYFGHLVDIQVQGLRISAATGAPTGEFDAPYNLGADYQNAFILDNVDAYWRHYHGLIRATIAQQKAAKEAQSDQVILVEHLWIRMADSSTLPLESRYGPGAPVVDLEPPEPPKKKRRTRRKVTKKSRKGRTKSIKRPARKSASKARPAKGRRPGRSVTTTSRRGMMRTSRKKTSARLPRASKGAGRLITKSGQSKRKKGPSSRR